MGHKSPHIKIGPELEKIFQRRGRPRHYKTNSSTAAFKVLFHKTLLAEDDEESLSVDKKAEIQARMSMANERIGELF